MIDRVIKPLIEEKLSPIRKDPIVSPDFEKELQELGERCGVELGFSDQNTESIFELGRARWRVRNGQLPLVDCPIMLKRGESCHGHTRAQLFELRTRQAQTYHLKNGYGDFVVTDKRLLFSGDVKSYSMTWEIITDWRFFSDGVEIRRGIGKPVTFFYGRNQMLFADILMAVRANYIS